MAPRYNNEEGKTDLARLEERAVTESTEDNAAKVTEATAREEKKRKRKLERQLFESEEGRRKIRMRQRDLQDEIHGATSTEELHELRLANNDVFRNVRHTREAALDAENNLLLATKMVQNAERLVQVPAFDPMKLVQKLSSKCGSADGGGFQWRALGFSCGVCFNSVPERVGFLAGPLDAELPEKKKADRARAEGRNRNVAKVVEVELKEMKDGEQEEAESKANRLGACEKNLKDMKSILKKKTIKKGRDDIPGAQFLLNPKSFTQTVENIFTFSFLVKKGEAEIGIRENAGLGETKGLYVAPRSHDAENNVLPKQSVLSFTMRDWMRLCYCLNVTEGDLPHRATRSHRPNNQ